MFAVKKRKKRVSAATGSKKKQTAGKLISQSMANWFLIEHGNCHILRGNDTVSTTTTGDYTF